jgi:hypothetical protein
MKMKTTCRGTFATGTQGFGFVSVNPWSMIHRNHDTSTNGTNAAVAVSQSTYAGTTVTARLTTAVTDVAYYPSNSPWANTEFILSVGGQKQFRLVGCGLRIRYIGTELNRAGRVVVYRSRDNLYPTADVSLSQLLLDNFYHSSPVDRAWKEISYFPSRTEDISYGSYDDPSLLNTTPDYRIMCALIEGAGVANAFEFEVDALFEVVGGFSGNTGITTTQSHSDPTGMGAIMSSLPTSLKATGRALYESVSAGAHKAIAYATSGLITAGAQALGGYFGGPLGAAAGGYTAGRLLQGPSRITVTDAD